MACFSKWYQGTILVAFVCVAGLGVGSLGPALPDLSCRYGVELDKSSYLIFALGAGGAIAQLIVPKQTEKMSAYLSLVFNAVLLCVYYGALTFSPEVYVAIVLTFFFGVVVGQALTVSVLQLQMLWPHSARCMHVTMSASSLGAVLGPLILRPFLSDGQVVLNNYRNELGQRTFDNNTLPVVDVISNSSAVERVQSGYVQNVTSDNTHQIGSSYHHTSPNNKCISLIEIPYLVFGGCSFLLLLALIMAYVQEKYQTSVPKYEHVQEKTTSHSYKKSEYLFIGVVCLLSLQGQGVPSGYSFLLPTFGTQSLLQLTLSKTTLMTSLFWLLFLIGRLTASSVPETVNQLYIILVCYCGMLVGSVILVFSLNSEALLWATTACHGLFSGPIFASVINWSGTIVQLTPTVVAVCVFSVGLGLWVSYIGGMLMGRFGVNVFLYFFPGFFVFNVSVFIIAFMLSRYIRRNKT